MNPFDPLQLPVNDLPTYRKSEHHLILEFPAKYPWPGIAEDMDGGYTSTTTIEKAYLERRAGLTWPTPHNDAYFCVMGILDTKHVTPTGRRPVELLHETRTRSRSQLFRKIAAAMKVCHCRWLLCDCSNRYNVLYHDLMRFCQRTGVDYVEPFDSSEDTGYLEAMSAIDDLEEHRFLRVDRAHVDDIVTLRAKRDPYKSKPLSHMRLELANLTPDDLHSIDHTKPEERFPAVAALNNVITSIELYPWQRPPSEKDKAETKRREGYG